MHIWIERLLDLEKEDELAMRLRDKNNNLIIWLADEIDLWNRWEIVSRQIGYPSYEVTIDNVFSSRLSHVCPW